MSIEADGVYKIRWREGGRQKSLRVHGAKELATKILRKRLSRRDENRHMDVKKEVNFKMSSLVERYLKECAGKKKSYEREKSVLSRIAKELGDLFVREVDGEAVSRWYGGLTSGGLSSGTAVRHFNVMHHMMKKAATIWTEETGIDRNPADQVEVKRPDDQRERYLSVEEILRLKQAVDEKRYRNGGKEINQTFSRLRLIVLIALTTGMRIAEIFSLEWSDLLFSEGLIVVRAKLKGGRIRYVPLSPELARELKQFRTTVGEERIFPREPGTKRERQRVDRSFETILTIAGIEGFRFHDLRHTFASWYMMNGGDLYELAKILGHSSIKMTQRYSKLGKDHIARTGNTAREMWKLLEGEAGRKSQAGA